MNARYYRQLAPLFEDPRLRSAFARIERDAPGALVVSDTPKPVLVGGAAALVEAA